MKQISVATRQTLEGLILLARHRAKELDSINALQIEVIRREAKISETEQGLFHDYLLEANRGPNNLGRTAEMLKKCCGITVKKK
jgi:hypothetical protein